MVVIRLCCLSPAYLSKPSLICDFCPSDQGFAYSFLQIPPHDGHPCCSAIHFPLPGHVQDFHLRERAHGAQTKRAPLGALKKTGTDRHPISTCFSSSLFLYCFHCSMIPRSRKFYSARISPINWSFSASVVAQLVQNRTTLLPSSSVRSCSKVYSFASFSACSSVTITNCWFV